MDGGSASVGQWVRIGFRIQPFPVGQVCLDFRDIHVQVGQAEGVVQLDEIPLGNAQDLSGTAVGDGLSWTAGYRSRAIRVSSSSGVLGSKYGAISDGTRMGMVE